jgi:hypothetical protein
VTSAIAVRDHNTTDPSTKVGKKGANGSNSSNASSATAATGKKGNTTKAVEGPRDLEKK